MIPVEDIDTESARRLTGLLFDLDGTLLDDGRLGEDAYRSLFRLREAGLDLLAVTGRPSGWGEILARQWPVLAVVAENGSIAAYRHEGSVRVVDHIPEAARRARKHRLSDLVAATRRRFPELRPTNDVHLRSTDFAFDIGETTHVDDDVIQTVEGFAADRGARTIRSSVHLHLTYDAADKASGAVRFLSEVMGRDPSACLWRYAFIGDSENDESCFAAFRTTIAVGNLSGRPTVHPKLSTRGAAGAGFTEAARALVARRAAVPERP